MPRVTQALGGRLGLSIALPLCTLDCPPHPPGSVSFQWNQSPEFQALSQRQQSRVPLKPRSCDVGVLPPVVEIFPFTYSQALMVFTLETMTMSLAPFHSDGR